MLRTVGKLRDRTEDCHSLLCRTNLFAFDVFAIEQFLAPNSVIKLFYRVNSGRWDGKALYWRKEIYLYQVKHILFIKIKQLSKKNKEKRLNNC